MTIPPHADILQYTAEELRRVVIDAARACEAWTKGPTPSVSPKLSQSFPYGLLELNRLSQPPRFSPGGRFLAYMENEHQLRLVDLRNDGCVRWVHDIREDCISPEVVQALMISYEICVTKSGSLLLAYISRMEHNAQYFQYVPCFSL